MTARPVSTLELKRFHRGRAESKGPRFWKRKRARTRPAQRHIGSACTRRMMRSECSASFNARTSIWSVLTLSIENDFPNEPSCDSACHTRRHKQRLNQDNQQRAAEGLRVPFGVEIEHCDPPQGPALPSAVDAHFISAPARDIIRACDSVGKSSSARAATMRSEACELSGSRPAQLSLRHEGPERTIVLDLSRQHSRSTLRVGQCDARQFRGHPPHRQERVIEKTEPLRIGRCHIVEVRKHPITQL